MAVRSERRPSPKVNSAAKAKNRKAAGVAANEIGRFPRFNVDEINFAETNEVLQFTLPKCGVSSGEPLAFAPFAVAGTEFGAEIVAQEYRAPKDDAVADDPGRDDRQENQRRQSDSRLWRSVLPKEK